jgi:hypothetical protein
MPDSLASGPNVDELARALGLVLVQDIAPTERDFYPEIIDSYRADGFQRKRKASDRPLGIGIDGFIVLASPLIYDAAKIVIAYLIKFAGDIVTDTFKDSISQIFAPNITAWIESKFKFLPKFHLTPSKADIVVAAVQAEMAKRKAPPELAKQVVDAVQNALASVTLPE